MTAAPVLPVTAWLDRLDQLRAEATPGPWFAWDRGVGWHLAVEDPDGPTNDEYGRPELLPEGDRTDLARGEDAALIVAAVNDLPKLTAAIRAVLELADELDKEAELSGEDNLTSGALNFAADRIRAAIGSVTT